MASLELQSSLRDSNQFKVRKGVDIIEEVLLKNSCAEIQQYGSSFDYMTILSNYRKEFKQKWDVLKPSPHVGECAYKFEDLPLLGVGKFGNVYLTKDRQTGRCFALKVLKKETVIKDRVIEKTIMERKVLAATDFPFLISLINSFKDYDYLYLGLPFIGGGDLFSYHRRRIRFSEHVARFYAAQVLLALEYLHNIKCLYRDLKLENILLDVTGYIKLTDFGLAKFVEDRTTTLCGTPEYLAPEMLRLKPYGTSVDWWTFGVLLYELVAGHTPFVRYSDNLVQMYSKICDGCFDMPTSFSADLRHLVSGLLKVQHATRLGSLCNGCIDIKNQRFFRCMNWSALLNQEILPPFRPRMTHPCDVFYFQKASKKIKKNLGKRSERDQYTKFFENF